VSETPTPTAGSPDWRRFGRSTVVPLLLLILLLVVLGHMHIDLITGYTAPRIVCDEDGGFVFYDGGGSTRDSVFFFRRLSEDESSATFGKGSYVRGVLAGVALKGDSLVTLYGDRSEKTKDSEWFYSLSKRSTLERSWSGHFRDPDLHLDFPRHVAALGSQVFLFGSDAKGHLRAARIDAGEKTVIPAEGPLIDGAFVEGVDRDSEERVPPPLAFATATDGEDLLVFWRVATEERSSGVPPGELRWARFNGRRFGPMKKFQVDLAAFALGPGLDGVNRVYGVKYGVRDSSILVYEQTQDDFRVAKPLTYEREGLGRAGVVALGVGRTPHRVFLFAQVGAAIRYVQDKGEGFGDWKDLARRPAEQMAVVYGWMATLLLISLLLIVQGVRAFGRRGDRFTSPLPPPATDMDELASIPERGLAFVIDLVLVLIVATLLAPLVPSFAGELPVEPRAQLTLLVWFTTFLLLYFIAFEAMFSRTPGKRFVGLEVQDVNGAPPSLAAAIYRNAFRIEILLPPLYVVPVLSLLVMLTSEHHQRPGDVIAYTTVRRSHTRGRAVVEEGRVQEPVQ
jgi:uncharacterized RDD family membrane protein YckC